MIPAVDCAGRAEAVANGVRLAVSLLKDGCKGFFSEAGRFEVYKELSDLAIFAPP